MSLSPNATRLRRWVEPLQRFFSDLRELEERRSLLDRPWEEDFLHWVHDGRNWHLHGHIVPPSRRRTTSVTSRGWCPGLSRRI